MVAVIAGRVGVDARQTGDDVLVDVGDVVSVPFNIACGRCRNCKEGQTGICLNVNPGRAGAAYGYVDMGGWVGGQNRWMSQAEPGRAILAHLAESGPEYLLLIPDWTSAPGADHSGECPAAVRAALSGGSQGYRQVAVFSTPGLLPAALRPRLDHPSVSPPVTIFARDDVARRLREEEGR